MIIHYSDPRPFILLHPHSLTPSLPRSRVAANRTNCVPLALRNRSHEFPIKTFSACQQTWRTPKTKNWPDPQSKSGSFPLPALSSSSSLSGGRQMASPDALLFSLFLLDQKSVSPGLLPCVATLLCSSFASVEHKKTMKTTNNFPRRPFNTKWAFSYFRSDIGGEKNRGERERKCLQVTTLLLFGTSDLPFHSVHCPPFHIQKGATPRGDFRISRVPFPFP